MFNLDFLRNEIIGNNTFFDSPYGKRLITYADYTASGKTLRFIEHYLIKIQEVYANTHTEDSYTGKTMTNLLKKAEEKIKQYVGANENNYIIPCGTGCTGAITKLSEILGLYLTPGLKYNIDKYIHNENRYHQEIIKDIFKNMSETKPIIFISPYEHHSNYLIWKESFCEVIEINLDPSGGIDLFDLIRKLNNPDYRNRIKIGSFSAASNVTGIKTDVYQIAKIFHQHNGLIFFDFAASGPYVEINMNYNEESYFDAIFLSPHKFIGGPGSSGILVLNKHLYSTIYSPTVAGGGTVDYVSPYVYLFLEDAESREKAGTPGILQIIKASLAFEVKSLVGIDKVDQIESYYIQTAMNLLQKNLHIEILGSNDPKRRIGILSFTIKHNDKLLHHKLVTRLLNDLFGIQSRAGCACAGPYGHRLLKINKEQSQIIENASKKGLNALKPGFTRVNFHYLMTKDEVDFICKAINFIANYGYLFLTQYRCNLKTGGWEHISYHEQNKLVENFGVINNLDTTITNEPIIKQSLTYNTYLDEAFQIIKKIQNQNGNYQYFDDINLEKIRWFNFILS